MARAGRKDRGLLLKKDATGKPIWYVRLWHEGRERRFGSFHSKTQAREFYEKAKQEQKLGRFFPERYRHGGYAKLGEIIDSHMATNTNKSRINDQRYASYWKSRCPDARLNTITPAVLEQAKHELFNKGLAPQTVLHHLKFRRHVLTVAVRDEKLERNPMAKVSLPKVPKGRLRFLTLEEEHALCEKIGATYAPWVRFAILTGLRRSEQFTLKWADMDQARGLITLRSTKVGHVQYVHLSQEALEVIEALKVGNASVWVFPSHNPDTPLDACNFYHRIYLPAVRAAMLDGVTWHTLRHTFASRLAMNGATECDIAASLRHSGTSLVKRYAHLSPSHLKGVMERVSAFGKMPTTDAREGQISNGTVTGTGNGELATAKAQT